MARSILAVAFALGAAVPAALAQDAPSAHLSAGFMACLQRAGDNTVQRTLCSEREAGAQDDRLNKAYQQVMRQLAADPGAHAALRDQERRWIAERDYTCKVNGATVDAACVVMKTAARADELESQVRF